MTRATHERGGGQSWVPKLGASLFLLFFVGLGATVGWWLLGSLLAELAPYRWQRTECLIESSAIQRDVEDRGNRPHRLEVRYRYVYAGRELTGDRLRVGYRGTDDASHAERQLRRYPAGSIAPCFVDPQEPESAVLDRRVPWWSALLALPLLFVAFFAFAIYLTWKPGPASASTRMEGLAAKALGPVTAAASKPSGSGCLAPFFGIFALVGGGILVGCFILPAVETLRARSWPAVPCEVVSSQLRTHPGDDGNTYSVDILYRYSVESHEYHSNRYDFLPGSTSGREAKERIIERYPAGTEAVCRVDPGDPTRAVLTTGFSREYWFAVIPLVFLAAGVGGIAFAFRVHREDRSSRRPKRRARPSFVELPSRGPEELRLRQRRSTKLAGSLFVTLLWDGLTAVFLYKVIEDWQAGGQPWFLTLFLLPFVLVGLLMLVSVPYHVLGLMNPRFTLTLDPGTLTVGGESSLRWRASGLTGRIRRLRIELEGVREARGGSSGEAEQTNQTFAKLTVFETERAIEMDRGASTVALPADALPSSKSGDSRIVWHLRLHGDIPLWPDIDDRFTLRVRPGPAPPPAPRGPNKPIEQN